MKEVKKNKKSGTLRAALICLLIFTLICGIIYPMSVTLVANAAFPYEANGSQIVVTLKDGSQKVYGSEFIGQNFEDPKYLLGRVNLGAPSNLSPKSDAYLKLLEERVKDRKEKLLSFGYVEDKDVPSELVTASGSGVDPHISPEAAMFQVPAIVAARNQNIANEADKITEEEVVEIINKYTEGRFLFVIGEKRVNVLLVNLSLDGVI